MTGAIAIAGAPVSFGCFELSPEGSAATLPDGEQVCRVLHEAGYAGVDLGPVGFLGTGNELQDRLARYDLELAGGWIDLPFSDDAAFIAALPGLDAALAVLASVAAAGPAHLPLPTLADSGDATRKAHPGGGRGHRLDAAGWRRFGRNVDLAAARVRDAGLVPTFHHHACTFVETPDEVDAFLEHSAVDLTFDTGHLLIGGGDPATAWQRWHTRINHLHLKDVRVAALRAVLDAGGGMIEVWSGDTFVALGDGDLDVAGMLDAIAADGYAGWLVVEQDIYPGPGYDLARVVRDQRRNRDVLRATFG